MTASSRRDFLQTLAHSAVGVAATSLWACSPLGNSSEDQAKMNFLFILVDDLGWADLGCYGSTFYETPHIDRLAAGGMRFTDAYAACPVCSPTRASILTGKYPARLHLTNWIPGPHRYPYSPVLPPDFKQELPLEEITIAEALQGSGYTSASIGKWHLGGEGFLPRDQGFHLNHAGTHAGSPRSYFYPQWEGRPPVPGEDGEYLTDHLTNRALDFIEQNRESPFFLYLPFYAVHTPIEGKEEYIRKYQAKVRPGLTPGVDQHNPAYAAMIQSVDENVGRLMAKLDDLGIAERTVIFFTSDNGGLSAPEWKNEPVTSNLPLREGKGHVYEGGIREPMIVKWPGVVPPGSVCREPVSSIDFFPTILDIAGAWTARIARQSYDGVSFVPLIEQSGSLPPRELYWHYPHYSNQLGRPGGAVRQGDFKLIEFYDDNTMELYNLREDVGERENLAERMPEKAAALRKLLDDWRKSVNAPMMMPNPNHNPGRARERVRPN